MQIRLLGWACPGQSLEDLGRNTKKYRSERHIKELREKHMLFLSGKTHVMCLLCWGNMQATFLLHFVA